jgi:nucleoside-triphosphatase
MARHLFFTGEKGVGKTTLLKGLLAQYQGPVGGFFTLKTTGVRPGRYTVHLLRPNQGEKPREENLLFCCGDPVDSHIAARFDGLGCAALAAKEDAGLLVMDEIGPHEQEAQGFCRAVFQALDGETPILGVLQRADTPLYARIANHPQVRLVEVTRENRDALAHMPICVCQEGIAYPGQGAGSRP